MTDLPVVAIEAAAEIEALLSTTDGYYCLGKEDRKALLAGIIAKKMEVKNG
jgi:hypothetical protein